MLPCVPRFARPPLLLREAEVMRETRPRWEPTLLVLHDEQPRSRAPARLAGGATARTGALGAAGLHVAMLPWLPGARPRIVAPLLPLWSGRARVGGSVKVQRGRGTG